MYYNMYCTYRQNARVMGRSRQIIQQDFMNTTTCISILQNNDAHDLEQQKHLKE